MPRFGIAAVTPVTPKPFSTTRTVSAAQMAALQGPLFTACEGLYRRLALQYPRLSMQFQEPAGGQTGYFALKTSPEAQSTLLSLSCQAKGWLKTTGYQLTLQSTLPPEVLAPVKAIFAA